MDNPADAMARDHIATIAAEGREADREEMEAREKWERSRPAAEAAIARIRAALGADWPQNVRVYG